MTKIAYLPLFALTLSLPASVPAWSQSASKTAENDAKQKDGPRYINTRASFEEVLRYNGFDFKVETYEGKDYLVVDVDGIKTIVTFYGKDNDLDSMQFYAGFVKSSATQQRMNEWNQGHRFTRAYIDIDGDPALEMDVNFAFGGVGERQLEDTLAVWEMSVSKFHTFVYENNKGCLSDNQKALMRRLRD